MISSNNYKKKLKNYINKESLLKLCLLISSFNVVLWYYKKFIYGDRQPFWDLIVNYCAGQSYLNNISPYKYGIGNNPLSKCLFESGGLNDGFFYVATIPLLKLSSLLAQFDVETIKSSWVLVNLLSLITIFYTSAYIYKTKIKLSWYLIILLFSFGGVNFFSLLTGNISIVAATFISIGIFFYTKNKTDIFCLLVCLAALLRPQFFMFILIPFMEKDKKYFLKFLFYSLTISILFFYDYFFNKELFFGFLKGLAFVRSDGWFFTYGDGIGLDAIIDQMPYAILLMFDSYIQSGPSKYSNFAWMIIASILLIGAYNFLRKKDSVIKINRLNSIALGTIIITACLPRLQMYDLFLAIPATHYIANNLMINRNKNISFFGFAILIIIYSVHDINARLFVFFLIYFYYFINNNFFNLKKRGIGFS